MKSKIISSYLNKDNGYSRVTIQNKYGEFKGYAFCHPDDMKEYSQFAGERYATLRAYKSFAKFRLKQEKIKLKTIQNLIKDIEYDFNHNNDFLTVDENSSIPYKKIKIKLRDYKQSVEDWENIYNFYEQEIKNQDNERQALLKRFKDKKN